MLAIEYILLGASILLLLSIVASKVSSRLGVPALLLFLAIGMLAGSEGPGGIAFADYSVAQALGVVALVYILFAGGLDTDWQFVRPVLVPGLLLSTLGVFITALLVGGFAMLVLDFSWIEGLLLGAIVSSTDAAAVFAVLRARGAGLRGLTKPLIELESGSNDPMAVFLTVGAIQILMRPSATLADLVLMFVLQMTLGGTCGYLAGRLLPLIVNRVRLDYEGLYPVLTVTLVLLIYSATTAIGGNGFLAVYLAGLVLGNSNFVHKRSLTHFHDGLAWLMQIAMFLTLGLLVFPSQLIPVIGIGLLTALFLMVIARPLSVFVALIFSHLSWRERALVAWVGLRGAVPIILATFPLVAGVPRAGLIFNLVFFIVLASVLLQGTTLPVVARWLGVAESEPDRAALRLPREFIPDLTTESRVVELPIPPGSAAVGKSLMELDLPRGALVVLIHRADDTVVPSGSTVVQPNDCLLVLAHPEAIPAVQTLLETA